MDLPTIFGVQFTLSLVVFALVLTTLAGPALARVNRRTALLWLITPHMLRHVGLVFLVPGVVATSMPPDFANDAGYGDLLTGVLAILAFTALRQDWKVATPMTWTAHLVGSVDLAMALRQIEVVPHFDAAWYIPTMLVPLLVVTHAMSFRMLLRRDRSTAAAEHSASSAA